MLIPLSTFSFQRKEPCMTPLRQRYLQDLQLRNYSPKTQEVYVECVSLFARHFGKSPELLGPEQIRSYQLFLAHEKKASWSRFNQTVCALRFLYRHTLHKDWIVQHIPFPRKESKLPEVLSMDEVSRLLAAIPELKYRVLLATIYATGLRASKALHLQVSDIDSRRQTVRVRLGEGHRDRYVILSAKLLVLLRRYWVVHPTPWLTNQRRRWRCRERAAWALLLARSAHRSASGSTGARYIGAPPTRGEALRRRRIGWRRR